MAQDRGDFKDFKGPGKCRYCGRHSTGLVDYKDIAALSKFISPQGKLFDRKRIGSCAKHQRAIARAVKRARFLSLLRYTGRP